MKGLYLNIDNISELCEEVDGSDLKVLELSRFNLDGQLRYSSNLWKSEPYIYENKELFIISGWFIYRGELNNLHTLYNDFKQHGREVLSNVELGSFVLLTHIQDEIEVFSDLIGLSTHYYYAESGCIRVAPSAAFLEQYTDIDPENSSFLSSQGHLFDNYTSLKSVFRLDPGAYIDHKGTSHVYGSILNIDYMVELNKVPNLIKDVTDVFDLNSRALAISGGLDSRLMLAVTQYSFGYTYGPDDSGDRVIARFFANDFKKYEEFSIQEALDNRVNSSNLCDLYFKYSSSWLSGLMEAYSYARYKSGKAHVLFDGYLGDVFQRGNYIKFSGVLGSLFKMLPVLYRLPISDKYILKKRYRALNDRQFERLYASFISRTANLKLNSYQKVTYYEIMYGRGGRYVINGGNVTANQLFNVVPVFMSKKIFNSFIYRSFYRAVSYRHLSKVWELIPNKYKDVRADSGLKPNTPAILAPLVNVSYRFLLRYAPWMGNYGDEIKKIKKR